MFRHTCRWALLLLLLLILLLSGCSGGSNPSTSGNDGGDNGGVDGGPSFTIKVIDKSRTAVSGATIKLLTPKVNSEYQPVSLGATNTLGILAVPLSAGPFTGNQYLKVEKDNLMILSKGVPSTANVQVTLMMPGALQLHLITKTGEAAAGIPIKTTLCDFEHFSAANPLAADTDFQATTDGEGIATFPLAPSNTSYQFQGSYQSKTYSFFADTMGAQTEAELPGPVTLTVLDTDDQPLPRVYVSLNTPDQYGFLTAVWPMYTTGGRTDDNGEIALTDIYGTSDTFAFINTYDPQGTNANGDPVYQHQVYKDTVPARAATATVRATVAHRIVDEVTVGVPSF